MWGEGFSRLFLTAGLVYSGAATRGDAREARVRFRATTASLHTAGKDKGTAVFSCSFPTIPTANLRMTK